jgi:hypothetical protein
MILNWIEGSISLIEFTPKTFVKAMLRGSVIPKCMNLATLNGFARCICWEFALHFVDKTNFIFWGFFQNFYFTFTTWLFSWKELITANFEIRKS